MFFRVLLIAFLLLCWILSGCGLSGSTDPQTPGVITAPPETVIFNISVIDGTLENAEVQLVSLREGELGDPVLTDGDGKASIEILKSRLDLLDNEDILFFYASSTSGTKLRTSSGSTDLQQGQVQFRSILPPAVTLKSRAELFDPITDDPEVGNLSQLSHFSNARTHIVEDFMRRDGVITEPLKPGGLPNIIFTSEILRRIDGQVQSVDQELVVSSSTITKKFKLLATATKAIVERSIHEILLNPDQNWTISNSDLILFELAGTTSADNNALHPIFFNAFSTLSEEITQDLTSAEFPFISPFSEALDQISEEETRESFEEELVLEEITSLEPILTSTTPLRSSLHFLIRSSRMRGPDGVLQIEPGLIPGTAVIEAPELAPPEGP